MECWEGAFRQSTFPAAAWGASAIHHQVRNKSWKRRREGRKNRRKPQLDSDFFNGNRKEDSSPRRFSSRTLPPLPFECRAKAESQKRKYLIRWCLCPSTFGNLKFWIEHFARAGMQSDISNNCLRRGRSKLPPRIIFHCFIVRSGSRFSRVLCM